MVGFKVKGPLKTLPGMFDIASPEKQKSEINHRVREHRVQLESSPQIPLRFIEALQGDQRLPAHMPRARLIRIHLNGLDELLVRFTPIIHLGVRETEQEMTTPAIGVVLDRLFQALDRFGM